MITNQRIAIKRTAPTFFHALLSLAFTLSLHAATPRSEVSHSPQQPRSGQPVTITAQLPSSTESVTLEYQILDPGKYIPFADPAYRSNWQTLPMEKSAAGYSAQIPASVQTHRRLIRYRLKAAKNLAWPAADSEQHNFAYFVYDGTPPWKAAIHPRGRDPKLSQPVEFSPAVMDQVQNYYFIARRPDVNNATWHRQTQDKEYNYTGAIVAHGKVYDHVRFRARGGEWRHAMGKNMWKFDFTKGNRLQARDDYGQPYKAEWKELNLRACIQQGDYGRRGEQGMYEAVGFRLFNLARVDAPRTHWISLRIIDGEHEAPASQYDGDFWGLYLALENEDGRFLEEHGLPDGNIYKMKWGTGELENQAAGQPTDSSDLHQLLAQFRRAGDEAWWRKNVNLPLYYSYRSILEGIHHYDLDAGKNYTFYKNPKTAQWHVLPWDIDLTWGDHMYGGGGEPFKRPVLSQPALQREYQNRLREIRDLLFNPDETGRLIDECAAIIWNPRGPSIIDADRAKWDYHPIMISRSVNPSKAGHGLFYQGSPTADFPGMVKQMKAYVTRRAAYIDRSLLTDKAVPETPTIEFSGPKDFSAQALTFQCSPPPDLAKFAALRWRVAEIDLKPEGARKPSRAGRYEISPTWESAELAEFNPSITIPPTAVKPGHTYRTRARMRDTTGRWSHWSAPIQFTVRE